MEDFEDHSADGLQGQIALLCRVCDRCGNWFGKVLMECPYCGGVPRQLTHADFVDAELL